MVDKGWLRPNTDFCLEEDFFNLVNGVGGLTIILVYLSWELIGTSKHIYCVQ